MSASHARSSSGRTLDGAGGDLAEVLADEVGAARTAAGR